jgi:hypothetical protein
LLQLNFPLFFEELNDGFSSHLVESFSLDRHAQFTSGKCPKTDMNLPFLRKSVNERHLICWKVEFRDIFLGKSRFRLQVRTIAVEDRGLGVAQGARQSVCSIYSSLRFFSVSALL